MQNIISRWTKGFQEMRGDIICLTVPLCTLLGRDQGRWLTVLQETKDDERNSLLKKFLLKTGGDDLRHTQLIKM